MGYYTSYIMKNRIPSGLQVLFLVLLAVIFWAIVFGTTYINFWLGMSCSSMVLAFFLFYGVLRFIIVNFHGKYAC